MTHMQPCLHNCLYRGTLSKCFSCALKVGNLFDSIRKLILILGTQVSRTTPPPLCHISNTRMCQQPVRTNQIKHKITIRPTQQSEIWLSDWDLVDSVSLCSILCHYQLLIFFFLYYLILFSVATASHISWTDPVCSTHVPSLLNTPTLVISRNELWLKL